MKRVLKKIISKLSPSYELIEKQNNQIFNISNQLNDIHKKLSYLYIKQGAGSKLRSGERQVYENISDFRSDHRERYEFAQKHISQGSFVLDIACGVGYGCQIIAEVSGTQVTGVDISEEAIAFAEKNFSRDNIKFICSSAEDYQANQKFDFVASFETIEHIEDDHGFVKEIFSMMKENGTFACSMPNQERLPYNPSRFPFHFRHYTVEQIDSLLLGAGFSKIEYFSQNLGIEGVENGSDGHFIIAFAKK